VKRRRVAALVAGLAAGAAGAVHAGGGATPGAYCPLPEPGQQPRCLAPARETYADYFAALERGAIGDADAASVEAAVAQGAAAEHAYLALSSLAHGYYELALREAGRPEQDPEVTLRLARWNQLLERAYSASPEDADYRAAVRRAATELRERAPVALPCVDERGAPSSCSSTESVLRSLDAADERAGLRGALERLLRRFFPERSS
jgi:hypothetical protein